MRTVHNPSAPFGRKPPFFPVSSSPSSSPSPDPFCRRPSIVNRSLRELGGGEGFGWAAKRRPAPGGERLREAHPKRWDRRGQCSARARLPREPGSFAWALPAHVLAALSTLLRSLPASPHTPRDVGTFPPTPRALKGPWEAEPTRFGPDLCAQRVPRPARAGILARASLRRGPRAFGGFVSRVTV